MDRLIYIDRFRGFTNTLIEVLDVNFLVGENSTGKTSVMEVIKVFAAEGAWYSENIFSAARSPLVHFSDMCSAGSKKFAIGAVVVSQSPNCLFLEFEDYRGVPRISKLMMGFDGRLVFVALRNGKLRYAVSVVEDGEVASAKMPSMWRNFQRGRYDLVRKIQGEVDAGADRNLSIFDMMYIVNEKVSKKIEGRPLFYPSSYFDGSVSWVAPIRAKPRRTYDEHVEEYSPEGDHVPYLIRSRIDTREFAGKVNLIGARGGLFDDVSVRSFGDSPDAPFELDVRLGKEMFNVRNVGYGVSQALPIIAELAARREAGLVAIQQPEVHLHPRAQASFGDMIFAVASADRRKLVIETHSDFLIDRFRLNCRKNPKSTIRSQILFFCRSELGNSVVSIPIDANGALPTDQPSQYREFFLRESMRMVGVE